MKKNHIYIILFFSSLSIFVCCTKEKFVYKNIETIIKKGLYLLDFTNTRQINNLNTVNIKWRDEDTATQFYKILLLDSNFIVSPDTTTDETNALYNNLISNKIYRHKIFSRPGNDSLIIRFRIGTTGDVDIKTE